MAKRTLKKNAKIILMILAAAVCVVLVFGIVKLMGNKPAAQDTQTHSEMLQEEGNLELIIPEDQDTGGF